MSDDRPGRRVAGIAAAMEYDEFCGKPRFSMNIHDITEYDHLKGYLITPDDISLREVFNNLDKDDRCSTDYSTSTSAGTVVIIAGLLRLTELVDSDPETYRRFGYDDLDLDEYIETEINQLQNDCMPYLMSYLYGRQTCSPFSERHPEIYEDLHDICCDVLWSTILAVNITMNNPEDLLTILQVDNMLYPVAYWDIDTITIDILTNSRIDDRELRYVVTDLERRYGR